jgi:DNA-binding transcriptional ArsR family regulator
MKEVKKEPQKDNLNLTILNLLSQGLNPKSISTTLKLSLSNLSYHLKQLKASGNIKKIGYGTWEVKTMTLNIPRFKDKQIRGHAFIWTIKLNKKFDWISLLKSDYKLVRNLIPRLIVKEHKVWLGKSTITIYESKSFYANNSIESRKYAVINLLEVLEALESLLKINLRPYIFKCAKEHYGMIKNDLARQYNRANEKMIIHDSLEGDWLWIDDSESLGELETKNLVRSKQVQDWWNDNKKHDFKVTPTFLIEQINKVTENQLMFAKNMESHIDAIKILGQEVKGLGKSIRLVKKENTQLKLGNQLTLDKW